LPDVRVARISTADCITWTARDDGMDAAAGVLEVRPRL
jgi:hypothetical protein